MKRRLRLRHRSVVRAAVALGAAAAVIVGSTPAAAQERRGIEIQAVDSRHHPVVTLTVAPPDVLADVDLPAEAFTLLENGERVPVEVTRSTETRGAPQTLEVVLVVDTSGSMVGAPLSAAKQAASAFVNQMPEGTEVAVLAFGDAPYVVSPMGTDRAAATAALSELEAAGETALHDGVTQAVGLFSTSSGARRALVVLSDGGDTVSTTSLEAAVTAVQGAEVEFAAVELVTPEYDGSSIQALAAASQGLVLAADDPGRLEALYGDVAATLLNRYAVTYTTRVGGETQVALAVDWNGVRAETERALRLPDLDGALAIESPEAATAPSPGWLGSSAALYTGLGFLAAALFAGLLWVSLREREAKVRMSARFGLRRGLSWSTVTDFADRASAIAEHQLERRGKESALYASLERAGMAFRPGEFVVLAAFAATMAFGLGVLVGGPLVGVLLAAPVAGAFPAWLRYRGHRRCTAFADQLPDTLQLLTGSLRAGHSILQAMDSVAHDAPAPTHEEFQRLVLETRLGRDLPDALRAMHERIGNADFEWFVQALQIHREVGGDLAEILDTVAGTIRERARLRRHVRSLSAEGRLSAVILFLLPVGVALAVSVMTPGYLSELFHGVGLALLVGAGVFMTGGFFWLRKLIRIDL